MNRVFAAAHVCLLVAVAIAPFFCIAQEKSTEVDSIFASLRSAEAPGATVIVVHDKKVVFKRGYGVRDLRSKQAIDSHTDFRLASVSKQFTAMAIMLLVHDGKLHYEDRLSDVLPDFPAYGKQITIRNLLNHTSGLLDYEDLMAKQYGNTPDERIPQIHDAGVLELLEKVNTTKFPPGSRWDYSNSGYCVLAMVVERVSSKPFAEFVRERIFAPLKMDHTLAFEKGKSEVPNRAYGNTLVEGAWQQTDQSSTSATLGDGGIYSSAEDLVRWDAGLRDHTLLSEDEMRPALTPVKLADTSGRRPEDVSAQYGFGWFLETYKGHRRMWHYGETVGFRTSIQRFPDDKLTVIVLCNRADLSAMDMAKKVADLYLGAAKN